MKGVSNHPGFEALVHHGTKVSGGKSGKKSADPIHIEPSHKGMLTKKVGKAGLKSSNLTKEIAAAKKSGNVKLEREEVFAQNAKKWAK